MAARVLVDAANDAGGKDNITVVLVEGPRFAPGVRRRLSSPRTTIPLEPARSAWPARLTFLLAGMVLSALLAFVMKPHWLDTHAGTVFGLGLVREPRTWRVSTDINNTVSRARPGDTVVVAPGTYNEQIRLREGIRLVSERPRQAVLRSNSISIVAEDVTSGSIVGFRIQPDDNVFLQVGIQLLECGVEVVDNEISGTVTAGIELQGSGKSIVRSNSVSARSGAAIAIAGDGEGPRVVHNAFSAEGHPAVVITGSTTPLLSGNVIRASEPFFVPPHINVPELLKTNLVAQIQGPRPLPRGRSVPRQDAPARVR
jgi:hypothetical protein